MFLQTPVDEYFWMAPYAYAIVFFGLLVFVLYFVEHWYAFRTGKPFFRQYLVYRKLNEEQKRILVKNVSFYNLLSKKHQRQFEHRISFFLKNKDFVGRMDLKVTDFMKITIAAVGCMLSFGRKNYSYNLVDTVLVYPDEFYSTANDAYHKGEFNPRHRVLAFSWKHFEEGYEITNDNFNLGIHEFMHAMQLESMHGKDLDSARFVKHFQNILKLLSNQELKDKLHDTKFFRMYAFSNQYEFMAVLAEHFFESPEELKQQFPEIYSYKKRLLNFDFAGY